MNRNHSLKAEPFIGDLPCSKESMDGCRCPSVDRCLMAALPPSRREDTRQAPCFMRTLGSRQTLYRVGDPVTAIYEIQLGSFKSELVSEDGREQVTGMHLPGGVLGIEGIASGRHTRTLVTLEDTVVCVIPLVVLDQLSFELPSVQRWLHRAFGREMAAVARDKSLLACRKADERLAAFILDLSRRYAELGSPHDDFELRMTREDIGNHIGLSSATVSRSFAEFCRHGWISSANHSIRLLDVEALKRLAAGEWRAPAQARPAAARDPQRAGGCRCN